MKQKPLTLNKGYKIPRFLYHGTTETVARKALVEGLKPRRMHEGDHNWQHTVASSPDMVYLTDTYAPYFAGTAAYGDERWGIVEIDTTKLVHSKFRPDEDCLEQGTRTLPNRFDGGKMNAVERTEYFRDNIDLFRDSYCISLETLGTVAYKGYIPPSAIRRISIYDWKSVGFMTLEIFNLTVTLSNHRWMSVKYKNITRWFMGEAITVADYYGDENWVRIIPPEQVEELSATLSDTEIGREIIWNNRK